MVYVKNEKTNLTQCSLYDRVKKLLVSYEWSDCGFSVLGKNLKAHKLILGISSPVFEAMFYGPLSTDIDIEITDIQPDIFQLMLNYIYTDNVEISSIEQAFELLYASRKYLLEHLTEICVAYIQANISVDNVIEVLNYPEYLHDKQLINYSLKLFGEHAGYLLQEKKHLITHLSMKLLLEADYMNICEKELIMHVFDWSIHLCKQNSLPATFENRKELLKKYGIFKLLRFCTLNMDELDEIIADKNNVLLSCEADSIKKIISKIHKVNSIEITPISSTYTSPRKLLKLQWHLCLRSPLRAAAPIYIDSNNYIIHCRLKVSKSVFINSLCVPTRMGPDVYIRNNKTKSYSEQLSVSIVCESDNNMIKHTNFMNTVEYDSLVNIELKEPCFIQRDKWYKVSFEWPHNTFPTHHSYIVEFRDKFLMYKGHKVTFEFDDLPICAGIGRSFLAGLKFCL